ncbi:MAG: hypothetical protein R3C19_07150 [Planctomycetaceae bacterium]
MTTSREIGQLKICLISLHGLIRATEPELGRDADTGGQVIYVLELAAELSRHPQVHSVELLTRQIIDPNIDEQYAQTEEPITDKARLVRIPSDRALSEEGIAVAVSEMFIDQTLVHFRQRSSGCHPRPLCRRRIRGCSTGGCCTFRMSFTGHSLGRVKKQRLLIGHKNPKQLDRKYHFHTRIEAEETALETASLVVTSTNQEVEQQYAIYDHYQPDRMEVIAPAVDLSAFHPPDESWTEPPIARELAAFLRDPEKPVILAMARPDERKNLKALVRVFGESEELQNRANGDGHGNPRRHSPASQTAAGNHQRSAVPD